MGVERAADGTIEAVTPARGAPRRESVMHFQTDRRLDDAGLEALEAALRRSLSGLRLAVRDFLPMVERVERMIEAAEASGARYAADEMHESIEFLSWLTDDNFIYLGYREYEVTEVDGRPAAGIVPGSGLGVLSDEARSRFAKPVPVAELDESMRERIFGGPLVIVSKTNAETTIHRKARMDYIGVKRVDAGGEVVGELRLIGLFTSKAYSESARQIPLVRRKLESIMQWEDLIAGSHDYKAVVALFDSFPKDELFAATASELRATIMALLGMQEEGGVRLFLRRDPVRRTVAAVVALPRDHVSTELRIRLEHLFELRFGGRAVDYTLSFATDPARFHFTIHVPSGEIPDPPMAELQQEVAAAARSWDDSLSDALVAKFGAGRGHELARRYAARFPDYYKSAAPIYQATFDVEQFERLGPDRPYVVALQNEQGTAEPLTRLKLYKTGGKAPLTDLLPLLEQLGLTVVEEVPTRLVGTGEDGRYLHDFGVLGPAGKQLDLDRMANIVADTVGAVWEGKAGSDWLNRLVVTGELDWRRVDDPARLPGVPPAARGDVHVALPERLPRPERRHLTQAGAALRAPLRPGQPQGRGRRGRARRRDRGRPGCRAEPRRRPHPARIPGHDHGDGAHERVPARSRPPVVQAALRRRAGDAQAGAAMGDLRVLDRDGRRAPPRGHGGARRHPLVGPARGLPHRDPGPHEGADGEERGDCAGRGQGRFRAEAPSARPRRGSCRRSGASTSR